MVDRRGIIGAIGGVALTGCGFRPLYGPAEAEGPGLRAVLAAVRVGTIPERFGQLLRRDLQGRFGAQGDGVAARYLLSVDVSFGSDALGFRRDGAITRVRYLATGRWALATLSVPPVAVVASTGLLRAIDGFNVPDQQFFAADSARDAMEQRLAMVMGEQIARDLAIALRDRPDLLATG